MKLYDSRVVSSYALDLNSEAFDGFEMKTFLREKHRCEENLIKLHA